MAFHGPCDLQCYYCPAGTAMLAYAAIVYTAACVLYLVLVRAYGVGSPFADSLSESQKRIKEASAKTRYAIFFDSVAIAALLVIVTKPLSPVMR